MIESKFQLFINSQNLKISTNSHSLILGCHSMQMILSMNGEVNLIKWSIQDVSTIQNILMVWLLMLVMEMKMTKYLDSKVRNYIFSH